MLPALPPDDPDAACGWLALPAGTRAEPLARAWLAGALGVPADALPLVRDARGRPRLGTACGQIDVSWSHSAGGLLVGWARGSRIGVDVEALARPRPRALELARRYFHPAEAEALAALPETARTPAFLRLWCAKEAVLKAHGTGLVFGLHRLRFDGASQLVECDVALGPPEAWRIDLFAPAPGMIAARALGPKPHAAYTGAA